MLSDIRSTKYCINRRSCHKIPRRGSNGNSIQYAVLITSWYVPKKYTKYVGKKLLYHTGGDKLLFILHTGLRVGEALALTWADYDDYSKTPYGGRVPLRLLSQLLLPFAGSCTDYRSNPIYHFRFLLIS